MKFYFQPSEKHTRVINRFCVLSVKIENFQQTNFDISNIFAQNIVCGYTLEPPHRLGGSKEYRNLCFETKIRKIVYPCISKGYCVKMGYEGGIYHRHVELAPRL